MFFNVFDQCVAVTEPQQSVAHMTGTIGSIYAPFDSATLMPDASAPKLIHVNKERPRIPAKGLFVKRPVIPCENLLVEESAEDSIAVNHLSCPPAEKMPLYVFSFFHLLFV